VLLSYGKSHVSERESNRSLLDELASVSTMQVISNGETRTYVHFVINHVNNFFTNVEVTTLFDIILEVTLEPT
jgi:hypothetical protein